MRGSLGRSWKRWRRRCSENIKFIIEKSLKNSAGRCVMKILIWRKFGNKFSNFTVKLIMAKNCTLRLICQSMSILNYSLVLRGNWSSKKWLYFLILWLISRQGQAMLIPIILNSWLNFKKCMRRINRGSNIQKFLIISLTIIHLILCLKKQSRCT